MPPIKAELMLKRSVNAMNNPNGTNPLFQKVVENLRLKIELLPRLQVKSLGTMLSSREFIVTPLSRRSLKKKPRNNFLLKPVAHTQDQ